MLIRFIPLATLLVLATACDSKPKDESEPTAATPAADEGKSEGKSKADRKADRKRRRDKDRGEASMMLGDKEWKASRARFKLDENGVLKLSMTKSDYSGEKSSRDSLDLRIKDFKGPGTYTVEPMGSRFIGVAIDIKAATAAGDNDEATKKEAMKAISGAKHTLLTGATVEVTAASDDEITGTFSWTPPKGLNKPAMSKGTFRAKLRVKRNKRK